MRMVPTISAMPSVDMPKHLRVDVLTPARIEIENVFIGRIALAALRGIAAQSRRMLASCPILSAFTEYLLTADYEHSAPQPIDFENSKVSSSILNEERRANRDFVLLPKETEIEKVENMRNRYKDKKHG